MTFNDPIPAAAVILQSSTNPGFILLVQRSIRMKFMPGFYAFPGGKTDPQDKEIAPGPTHWDISLITAARELFEETGVLVARNSHGELPSFSPKLADCRRKLLAGEQGFAEVLQELKMRLVPDDFSPAGIYTTPIFSPIRFQTWFFLSNMPGGQEIEVFPTELQNGKWDKPGGFISLWQKGECLLSPPVLALTEFLAGHPHEQWKPKLVERLSGPVSTGFEGIRFAPEIQMVPVVCTGPGVQQTGNVYFLGSQDFFLLDPGPLLPEGLQAIESAIEGRKKLGHKLAAILLTHHHPDHAGKAGYFREKEQVPVLAHEETESMLVNVVKVDKKISDGEILALPNGDRKEWLALHTPGHAPGHMVFFNKESHALMAGDLVSPVTTILVGPPEGHLQTYLDSLRKALALDPRMLFPFHGPPTPLAKEEIYQALQHREKRELALLDVLATGARSAEQLTREIYRGLQVALLPSALKQVLGGLIKLVEEGKVRRIGVGESSQWELGQ